ncbi:MAG: DUF1501 domain-containing protein, partial [Gemmataceae bacterium]
MLSLSLPGSAANRREFLRIGALGLGGLSLPQLLRAEQARGISRSHKAVIMIYLVGAPPHQDMYDLKPDAPSDIRGEFKPIPTAVPGIQICEHLPNLARVMKHCVPMRSVYGSPDGDHDSFICYTGRSKRTIVPGMWPALGSTVSKLLGPAAPAMPPVVGLAPPAGHAPYGSPGHPGYLGITHGAFRPAGAIRNDIQLTATNRQQLPDRKTLLAHFDTLRRDIDTSGGMNGIDQFQRQALEVLSSSALANALDLSQEPAANRARYGTGDTKNYADGAPRNPEHFLMARRLIEAGARVVTLNFGRWDFHSDNFNECKKTHFPIFDKALAALISDLSERGMLDDVAIIAWGEFGRTPLINKDAGRDHWPEVGGALLAGGRFRTGQVIG